MAKKTNFGLDFDPFWPKFFPQNFSARVFFLTDVIHCCKESLYAISMKTNVSNMKNDKYPSFGPDFGRFSPNLGQKFFSWILHQLDVMNYCKLSLYWTSRKTNENKVEKIAKNLVSGPILARFGLNSLHPPKNIFVGFTSTKCYALLQAIVERNFKEN